MDCMSILQSLHNAWCVLTGKCEMPVPPLEEDEYVNWLKSQQRASIDAREEHSRKANRLEELLLRSRLPNQDGAGHK
jgi:hypothetical protein